MSRDTFILIAFCLFTFLVGMRLKQRYDAWKQKKGETHTPKNQHPGKSVEPEEVRARRLRREKRVRFFTIAQLVVLVGLMFFMAPALVKDFMAPGHVDASNIFLRCLIFIFTIYIFILGYLKVFRRKKEENTKQ